MFSVKFCKTRGFVPNTLFLKGLDYLGSHQFSQGDPGLCLGASAFPIVDLTSHGQWNILPVRSQKSYSGSFAWRGNHPSLATCEGAIVEVVKARYQNCSSKLRLSFVANEPVEIL